MGEEFEAVEPSDTESDPEEAPSETEELQSLGSRVPLMGEEFEAVEPSGTRTDSSHLSTLLDSTIPFSPDHSLTHVSPTPTPTRVSFPYRTARMVVRTQQNLSPGMSARIAEAVALSLSSFRKRYRSSYDTSSPSSSLTLPVQKRYRGTSELILDTDSERDGEDTKGDEEDTERDEEDESLDADEKRLRLDDEGHGLDDEDHSLGGEGLGLKEEEEEEVVPDGQQQAVPIIETTVSEPLGLRYGALRRRELAVEDDQPTLVTWLDSEDDRVYANILAYAPPVAPVQTPPSPEWSFGSLLISPSSSLVPSPIALRVATSTATILVDEDQFLERYMFKNLESEQERTVMTFGALWRPVLALDAWAGRIDTRLADMSWDRYDDHRLIHDMLMQQAAKQRELQEMRGCVTTLEQERDRRE
ncbi:hypothetical protein Tco_0400157 [Tanacetum coccineum]